MIIEDDFLYSLIFFFFIYKIEIMYISSSKKKKKIYVYEYMCVKLSFRDINHGPYSSNLTNTSIYKVIIALNACNC